MRRRVSRRSHRPNNILQHPLFRHHRVTIFHNLERLIRLIRISTHRGPQHRRTTIRISSRIRNHQVTRFTNTRMSMTRRSSRRRHVRRLRRIRIRRSRHGTKRRGHHFLSMFTDIISRLLTRRPFFRGQTGGRRRRSVPSIHLRNGVNCTIHNFAIKGHRQRRATSRTTSPRRQRTRRRRLRRRTQFRIRFTNFSSNQFTRRHRHSQRNSRVRQRIKGRRHRPVQRVTTNTCATHSHTRRTFRRRSTHMPSSRRRTRTYTSTQGITFHPLGPFRRQVTVQLLRLLQRLQLQVLQYQSLQVLKMLQLLQLLQGHRNRLAGLQRTGGGTSVRRYAADSLGVDLGSRPYR